MSAYEVWIAMRIEVARLKPELLPAFDQLYMEPTHTVGEFLDANFPISGGWSTVLIYEAPETLQEWKP